MALGDHYRLAVVGDLAGQQVVNVYHYRQTSANTSANSDVASLAIAFDELALATDVLTDPLSDDLTWQLLQSRSFPLPGTPPVGSDRAVNYPGLRASPALPPSNAVVVKRKTAFLGRAYRGRIFLPGLPSAAAVDGLITAAGTYQAEIGVIASFLKTPIQAAAAGSPSFQPELCKVIPKPIPPPDFMYQATDVTASGFDKIIRSQRRREIGVGV